MIYIFYHANCFDGFTSAYVAYLKFGSGAQYIPVAHGEPYPNISYTKEDEVYILDFAFDRQELLRIKEKVRFLQVIDHHKTAAEKLSDLTFCHFDMNYSGALLTWNYFFPDDTPPLLIKYISDRDLWQFVLPFSKEISAYIAAFPKTFESWGNVRYNIENHNSNCVSQGELLLQQHQLTVEELVKYGVRYKWYKTTIKKYLFFPTKVLLPTLNVPKQYGSDCCDYLIKQGHDMAVYWLEENNKLHFGIRAKKGFDSTLVSSAYGGGGHAVASGWQVNK